MLVIPRTAVSVSHPPTNRFCAAVNHGRTSLENIIVENSCSMRLEWKCYKDWNIELEGNIYRKIQKARKTQGTFNRCHSFSTNADNPKFVAKFLAC